MKVYIGPYRSWIGPYQIADKLFFWMDKDKRHDMGTLLAGEDDHDTWLTKVCQWIDKRKKRKVKIRIDPYDTWSMDHTLSQIILPMLKQLQKTKHGAPHVDDEDVPEHLRSTAAPAKENDYDIDDNHFKRWDWVLDEMIQAFECQVDEDWDKKYHTGVQDYKFVKEPHEQFGTVSRMVPGPNHTHVFDSEGYSAHEARNKNGFRLFGKYYQALWD